MNYGNKLLVAYRQRGVYSFERKVTPYYLVNIINIEYNGRTCRPTCTVD